MTTFCLDVHAAYGCRRSGACCETWAVPAESTVVQLVQVRGLRRDGANGNLFHESPSASGDRAWVVARDNAGDCVFFDRRRGHLCVIHEQAGVDALPSACRHFPRKVLHDSRGTLVSLSHFCPTAARLLLTTRPPSIVGAHPPLRLLTPMEGLDATDALPPLVRPGLLADPAGYDAWERAALAALARDDVTYDRALEIVSAATETLRGWRPGACSMKAAVSRAFERPPRSEVARWSRQDAIGRIAFLADSRAHIDPIDHFDERWTRRAGSGMNLFDRPMKNYLAARLFGNWMAYQGRGLRTIVEWLRTCAAMVCHDVLRRLLAGDPLDEHTFLEAVRSADLLLLHVIDTAAFGKDVAAIEGPSPT